MNNDTQQKNLRPFIWIYSIGILGFLYFFFHFSGWGFQAFIPYLVIFFIIDVFILAKILGKNKSLIGVPKAENQSTSTPFGFNFQAIFYQIVQDPEKFKEFISESRFEQIKKTFSNISQVKQVKPIDEDTFDLLATVKDTGSEHWFRLKTHKDNGKTLLDSIDRYS